MGSRDRRPVRARRNARIETALPPNARAAIDEGRIADAERLATSMMRSRSESAGGYLIFSAIAEHQGRMRDALSAIEDGLRNLPESIALRCKLGMLLVSVGELARGEVELRYALELAPDTHELIAELGKLLANQGRHREAEGLYRKALAEAPGEPQYLQMAARLAWVLGRPEEARAQAREAVAQARARLLRGRDTRRNEANVPIFRRASLDFADMAEGTSEFGAAVGALADAVGLAGDPTFKLEIANRLCRWSAGKLDADAKQLMCRALDEAWIEPVVLSQAASRSLAAEHRIAGTGRRDAGLPESDTDFLKHDAVSTIAHDPLFLAVLAGGPITSPELERLATRLRRALLEARFAAPSSYPAVCEGYGDFLRALAIQCLSNDYAFEQSDSEKAHCDALAPEIGHQLLHDPAQIRSFDIALLASYRPLREIAWARDAEDTHWPEELSSVVNHHLRWPQKERAIAQTIPCLTPVRDPVSVAVQRQYEESPYPRWNKAHLTPHAFTLNDWLDLHFPGLQPCPRDSGLSTDILVAGCGTGRDAIDAACRFANARVLAIDLSLASLAYAERKRAALGLDKIRFAQADILELAGLGQDFDVVDTAGVLHHLRDPVQGWRVLKNLVRPGGIMMIALYSERGRADLLPARAFVAERRYGTTPQDLRRFRADVMALAVDHPVRQIVDAREEFYSLSMLRDLLFHVEEHVFTIAEIAMRVDELELEFCGFAADPVAAELFSTRFGESADRRSLRLWGDLEEHNPRLFSGMYHFVVRNPGKA